MESNPLPNSDSEHSDSEGDEASQGTLTHYVARLTSYDKFTFDELKEALEEEHQLTQYLLAREIVPKEHFHIVLSTDSTVTLQDVKDIFRAFLVPFWQGDDGRLPRGFGNKQFCVKESYDLDAAVSYALKDRNEYHFVGFTQSYIKERLDASFQKKKPSNFKSELFELNSQFKDSNMTIENYMTCYVRLKAKYGQQVRLQDAYGYALSVSVDRDPEIAGELVNNFLDRL